MRFVDGCPGKWSFHEAGFQFALSLIDQSRANTQFENLIRFVQYILENIFFKTLPLKYFWPIGRR